MRYQSLCVMGKWIGTMLIMSITYDNDGTMDEVQCGFRSGKEYTDKKKIARE